MEGETTAIMAQTGRFHPKGLLFQVGGAFEGKYFSCSSIEKGALGIKGSFRVSQRDAPNS